MGFAVSLFQENQRDIDLSLIRLPYLPKRSSNDGEFLGPVGKYDLLFISGSPRRRKDYLTLIWVFDEYIWTLLLLSVAAVSIVLVSMNKIYENWSNATIKEPPYQGTKYQNNSK